MSPARPYSKVECAGLESVADQFFKYLIVDRDINLALKQVDLTAVQEELKDWSADRKLTIESDDWVRRILLLWLVEDHGAVEAFGHGVPFSEGYKRLPRTIEEAANATRLQERKYATLAEAITEDAKNPYAISPIGSKLCATYFRFRRLHHDALTLIWSGKSGKWQVSRLYWIAL